MIKNYLKTALRIMLRQKAYSAINISGLSIGIAASLLIILYVADELSFDRFHKDADRIYRVVFFGRLQGNDFTMATSPAPVAEAMVQEIPAVESSVRFGIWRTMPMSYGDKNFTEEYMAVADSNFFDFFTFPLVSGDAATALKGTNKIVLTQSTAKRYFGDENPIGKIILRGSEKTATEVTGVVQDAPSNSHIRFDMILSGETWDYLRSNTQWTSNNIYTYFKLRSDGDLHKVKTQLDGLVEKHMGAELEKYLGFSFSEFKKQGNNVGLNFQPMPDIHLTSNLSEEISANGNMQYIYIFMAIAVFIILIACINFMNLSTARSANRAKEVGVRKSIGAMTTRLIGQFLAESMIYSFISTILALLIIILVLNPFNTLSGKTLTLSLFANPVIAGGIVVFAIIVGFLAGSYPAFYLTAFKPVEVLKGKIRSGFKNSKLRNSLVVFQFMISIALILGSAVVYKQLKFMQEKNMGFDKENVIRLLHTWSLDKNGKAFKNELLQHPEFKNASYASNLPPNITWSNAWRKVGTEQDFLLNNCYVDVDHLAAMGYTMKDGRFFSRDFPTDSTAVILNESAFKLMGFERLENQTMYNYNSDIPKHMTVIGVVKDFNYETLRNQVKPLVLILGGEPNGEMAIRLAPGDKEAQIKLLQDIWKKYSTSPFQYSFLDQDFDALFRAEQRMGQIILLFTLLTIFIACLGLFGLSTYVGEQRAKEISIRKVLGASVMQVMGILFKDFTLLIIIAFAIAAPLGWYLMQQWLQGFAFHTGIDTVTIILSGAASLLIATVTISFQSIRAARENPVKALKSE
ncbi:MAG TPA: ABC transporter permease [Ohtaekwangia sp.]|uniref:ABC transporter permease n=1 Tax=Ohtaekwangia sp. TaxID=2066019 RepID=UPI002F93F383